MAKHSRAEDFNPVNELFKDVSAFSLCISSLKIFIRIAKLQGLAKALRVFPIVWTIIQAVRGFSKYHAEEYARLKAKGSEALANEPESEADLEEYRVLGRWLRDQLHELGPTFIKIGQMLSTRADIIPLPAMLELATLQESVEPFPTELAYKIIQRELGKLPQELFAHFNPKPIAAASLSQAFRASLDDGRDVVVKVQRPNLADIISCDVQVLGAIADEVMNYPSLCRHTDWPGIVQEFARTTFEEIDYIREGRNADRFRHNFRGNPRVFVPRIIWKFTGRRVLTIEYVPGARVTDVATLEAMSIEKDEITSSGANFYLKQLLEDGFFHADPHPGNIRIMPDGRIGLFDFGMVGIVTEDMKRNLISALINVMQKDYVGLVDDFIGLGFLTDEVNKEELAEELEPIVNTRFSEGMTKVRFRQMLFDFSDICYRYPFRLPTEFTYIMRALLTLEGIALTINPEFNFLEVAMPYAQKVVMRESGVTIGKALLKEVFIDGKFSSRAALNLLKAAAKLRGMQNGTSPVDLPTVTVLAK